MLLELYVMVMSFGRRVERSLGGRGVYPSFLQRMNPRRIVVEKMKEIWIELLSLAELRLMIDGGQNL
jgi:hypothetical protein